MDFHMLSVTEEKKNGIVVIGGRKIDGFIDDRVCPRCGNPRIYYGDYDSYVCARCNTWLESLCGDPTCEYCRSRPESPFT
jgi:DNA-directed RNA polymerase subunit RPC12/RpoP